MISLPPGTEMFHFPGFASYAYVFSIRYADFNRHGLPHSDSHGSTLARSSPWIFVACHVLPRLLMPWHPPYALTNLTLTLSLLLSKNNAATRGVQRPAPIDSNRRLQNDEQKLADRKLIGGGERDRTDDLLLAKQALSQLSYTPTSLNSKNQSSNS